MSVHRGNQRDLAVESPAEPSARSSRGHRTRRVGSDPLRARGHQCGPQPGTVQPIQYHRRELEDTILMPPRDRLIELLGRFH